jgi:hypothetical protein
MSEPLDRARELLAFSPVVGIPLTLGVFVALFVQLQGVRAENATLRSDVAALHKHVVEVRKRVDHIDLKVRPASVAHTKKSAGDKGGGKKASGERKKRPEGASGERKKRPEGASGERKKRPEGAAGAKKRQEAGGGDRARSGARQKDPARPGGGKSKGNPSKSGKKGSGDKRKR